MEPKPEQQPLKRSTRQQPYISDEVLRPLARIIAHRLLAKQKFRYDTSGNKKPAASPETDFSRNQEGDV